MTTILMTSYLTGVFVSLFWVGLSGDCESRWQIGVFSLCWPFFVLYAIGILCIDVLIQHSYRPRD